MKRLIICALALGGFAVCARAAGLELDKIKDPLPDTISFASVVFYGTVDVGYGYQTNGLPVSGAHYTGLNYVNQRISEGPISTIVNNAMEQSKIGAKVEQGLAYGFTAIAKLETGFNPISGELSDACASVLRAAGYAIRTRTSAYNDGGRCGQWLNGDAYGGISNPAYGTLTIGRQSSLINDAIGTYDPNRGSYAFSLIGYSGSVLGGIGSTETTRWDNSVRYVYQYGPAHAAVMYSSGGQDTSIFADAFGANIGASLWGFSIDGYYQKENGAVAISPDPFIFEQLNGVVTDNEAWSVMGKYAFEAGGGLKDEGPSGKVTLFGGYAYITLSNPSHDQGFYNHFHTLNGYEIVTNYNHYQLFGSDKVLQTYWAGAAYETGPWTITGAYYHHNQNSFLAIRQTDGAVLACNPYGSLTTTVGSVVKRNAITASSNCSGDIGFSSFVVDYRFNKHFDVYAGVSVAGVDGGLGSGFLTDNTTNFATGLRVKF